LNHNILSLRNPNNLKHLTAIVLLLLTLLCPSDAIPLVKFNRWVSDDIIRRGYNGLSSFPYKASKPPYRTFPSYSLIDPFHSYFALPLHKNTNPLQQKFDNVEPIQRSILSNTEVIKPPRDEADYDMSDASPEDIYDDEEHEEFPEVKVFRSLSRNNARVAIDPRQEENENLMSSLSSQNLEDLGKKDDEQISEAPLIKEKYGESSKRSSTSLESKSMLSLVKMFMKLKAEGFDIRPTRKDKDIVDSNKMSNINPDDVMVCKSAPYNICYKVDQKAGKLIPISRNIKPVRILRVY